MASALCLVVVIYLIGSTLTDAKAVYNLSFDDPAGSSRNTVFIPNNSEAMLRDAASVTVEEVKPTSGGYQFIIGSGAERTVYEDYARKKPIHVDGKIGPGVWWAPPPATM